MLGYMELIAAVTLIVMILSYLLQKKEHREKQRERRLQGSTGSPYEEAKYLLRFIKLHSTFHRLSPTELREPVPLTKTALIKGLAQIKRLLSTDPDSYKEIEGEMLHPLQRRKTRSATDGLPERQTEFEIALKALQAAVEKAELDAQSTEGKQLTLRTRIKNNRYVSGLTSNALFAPIKAAVRAFWGCRNQKLWKNQRNNKPRHLCRG
jgi:hypothetical protein